ncbi:MAG: hypothetical protein JO360_10715 [Acidobacteria bacterium]|nr:hypothetical protein [Acidobacteriota bacterium]
MGFKHWTARRLPLFFICGVGLMLALPLRAQDGRVLPPAAVTCDRNHLTIYPGMVLSYTRRADRIVVRIRTDYDTTETVTLRYTRGSSPARWFLLNGEKFERGDWSKIEAAKGKLHPNMRVRAWVCDDGNKPVLDWQPPSADTPNPPRSTP